jgi:quercetin dioxygenase-like cupin family protein
MSVILQAGQGKRLEARGSSMLFKAVGMTTANHFSLMDRSLPPHGRPPAAHRHSGTLEAFFVLEGALTFRLAGEPATVGPGGFVIVPKGVGHTFANEGDMPARTLIIHAPALDAYFEDLAEMWARSEPPSIAEEFAVMRRHGLEPVDG